MRTAAARRPRRSAVASTTTGGGGGGGGATSEPEHAEQRPHDVARRRRRRPRRPRPAPPLLHLDRLVRRRRRDGRQRHAPPMMTPSPATRRRPPWAFPATTPTGTARRRRGGCSTPGTTRSRGPTAPRRRLAVEAGVLLGGGHRPNGELLLAAVHDLSCFLAPKTRNAPFLLKNN